MTDPFAAYAQKALSTAPARLTGVMKTRAEARLRYAELVAEMAALDTKGALADWLHENRSIIAQFSAHLPFLWFGDGDFLGLEREIACATARVDDGLDFPRWDPSQMPEASLGASS